MAIDKQNATGQGGASRNQLSGWLLNSHTARAHQTQRLNQRFYVSHSMARTLARLAYGEVAND